MKIRRRWLLVTSISAAQFCGLMLAIGWFVTWLETHLDALAAQRDLALHAQLISHIGDLTVGVASGMGLVLAVCCTLLNALVVARYESRLARSHADLELLVQRRTESLLRHRDAIIFGLARLADSRDNETGEHLERIRAYSAVLVRQLARSEPSIDVNFVHEVPLASTLHDIGKVGIPDAIPLKPGPFSPEERAIMQQHATIGGECLAAIKERLGEDDFIELARQIALAHHEREAETNMPAGTEVAMHVRRLVENLSLEGERQSASLARLREQCTACGAHDLDGRPLADSLGELIQRQVRLSRRLLDIAGKLDLQLPRVERRASALARDELGLLHRAAFDSGIMEALRRQVGSEPLALILIGLEWPQADEPHEAAIEHWRLVGAVAQFLSRITRRYDLLGRYDEQTIAIGIRGITLEQARKVSERVRSMLATRTLQRTPTASTKRAAGGASCARS
jgi:GGDEF domain-containing protein